MEEPKLRAKNAIVANGVGYDASDIDAPGVTVFTLIVVGILLAVFFGITLYYEKFNTELTRERIDESPAKDLGAIRAREDSDLNGYKFVDKPKGVVRIPIEQAMKSLLVEVPAGKAYSTKDQAVKVEPAAGAAPASAPAPAAPVAPVNPAPAKPAPESHK
jgi:hypothetical protein